MYTPLGFGLGNPLNTVYSRFIFHLAVGSVADDIENDFLESAHGAFRKIDEFDLPAAILTIFRIHPVKVTGKNTGFITSCTGTDFHNRILPILWIGWYKHHPDILFQFRFFVV